MSFKDEEWEHQVGLVLSGVIGVCILALGGFGVLGLLHSWLGWFAWVFSST